MVNENKSIYKRISSANILSDGMLNPVNYQDFAFIMVAKDRPLETRKNHNYNNFK